MPKIPQIPVINLDEVRAELCKRSLSYFVKEFWSVIATSTLVWNWHLDVLCDEIQAIDERVFARLPKLHDAIFNVPPGTSKTKILSILSTAWEFARCPSIKTFVGSYSDSAVIGIADEIRLLLRSEKYKIYFPEVEIRKDFDTKHEFKTSANGHFYAFTVNGTLTSKHADILKIDDPLNPQQATSDAELESTINFFDKTLPTRKTDKEITPTMLIMQRLSTKDPTGHLLEQKGSTIRHICLPGELSGDVKPAELKAKYKDGLLDPVRLSRSALAELKLKLGGYGYAGQIQQVPAPAGGLIWQKWFIEIDDAIFPKTSSLTQVSTDWDLAYTKNDDNAASAYITFGKHGNDIFIIDLGWAWLEFPALIKYMKVRQGPHYIEAKASGKSAKQTLTKQGINAIEVKVKGGEDKVSRARMATPVAESGRVYIKKSLADRLYNDSKQGILNFPKGPCKDLADVLAQGLQRLGNVNPIHVADVDEEDDILSKINFDQ